MCKQFEHVLSLVAVVFLVFACVFVLGDVKAATSSGPPIVEESQEWYTIYHTYVRSVFADELTATE